MATITGDKLTADQLNLLLSKIEKGDPNDCWEWKGSVNKKDGYGQLVWRVKDENGRSKQVHLLAHRLMWEHHNGMPLPDGLEPDHICVNPLCNNPAHLEAVTHLVNCRRRDSRATWRDHRELQMMLDHIEGIWTNG